MNTASTTTEVKSSAVQSKRYGRPQIIRVLVSSYLHDLRSERSKA